jgi:Tfp pilus assembly protein PilF
MTDPNHHEMWEAHAADVQAREPSRVLCYKPDIVRVHAEDYPWALLVDGKFRTGYQTLEQAVHHQSRYHHATFEIDWEGWCQYQDDLATLAQPYLKQPEAVAAEQSFMERNGRA